MVRSTAVDTESIWADLSESDRSEFRNAMRERAVARGETLVEQDTPSDILFIVVSGLFEVVNAQDGKVVAEIGAGQLIGEIGFFAGSPRTASVIAARDCEVLEISRAEFDALTARTPQVQRAVTRALARRLAHLAPIVRNTSDAPLGRFRVVAVVGAGARPMSGDFIAKLRQSFATRQRCAILTAAEALGGVAAADPDRLTLARWIAGRERENDLVICIADTGLSEWTQATLRSSDQVLIVAEGGGDPLNPVEALALQLFPVARRRLIHVQPQRAGIASSAMWSRERDAFMVHHVSLQDLDDFRSLARFLTGEAIGFVAGGGGAFGPAHVGIFKAFRDAGVQFDIHGGSSVGAAMCAAFSLLMDSDAMKAATHEMFVRSRAFKRFTLPRYGLLDHKILDEYLQRIYGAADVEDMWKPFFAVATDLSTYSLRLIRKGAIWEAIRASCSIPGVLPPFFDHSGHLLVDGGVVDNVPVSAMNSLKSGPNLVVDLRPLTHRFYDLKYASLPGRSELLRRMVMPWPKRKPLPRVPGPAGIIQRSIFGNIGAKPRQKAPNEITLRPPAFRGSSFMNWDRHAEVLDAAYEWGRAVAETLRSSGDASFTEMTRLSRA